MCKDCGCEHTHDDMAVIPVEGMTCGHCTASVEEALLKLPGVLSASADLEKKNVTVHYNSHEASLEAMTKAIENIGFEVGKDVEVHEHAHGLVGTIKKFFQ